MPHPFDINYELLPAHIRGGFQAFIENGHSPGGFICAVLANNLTESFGRADEENRTRMFDIASFMYNEAPGECWGSKDKVAAWSAKGGLNGQI